MLFLGTTLLLLVLRLRNLLTYRQIVLHALDVGIHLRNGVKSALGLHVATDAQHSLGVKLVDPTF